MPPKSRRRNLAQSRRRTGDDGDDDNSAIVDGPDDSQSEYSASSIDAGDSEHSDPELDQAAGTAALDGQTTDTHSKPGKRRGAKSKKRMDVDVAIAMKPHEGDVKFRSLPDTEAMMNGLDIKDSAVTGESISFDEIARGQETAKEVDAAGVQEHVDDAAGNEQDLRRPRKGVRPPGLPARSGYFMHDVRGNLANQTSGGQPARRGGIGRGAFTNGLGQSSASPLLQNTSKAKWDHDLHDTLLEHDHADASKASQPAAHTQNNSTRPMANSLSSSTSIGTVSVRVLLPDMQKPIIFERMPVRQHTRLPDLRPPLRRDKPVRIAVPHATVRYIFPSVDRSFIFIPRAQRPGMHSGRARARGGFNQYGSRRSSMYGGGGGSNYTPSIARSRRSSQARDGLISPTGSVMSRAPFGAPTGPARPVVKLPVNGQPYDMIGAQFHLPLTGHPMVSMPPHMSYAPPAQPVLRETHGSQIPMHQPRPQKQVSVASIESPTQGPLHAPQQQEQQPFHHQVPSHISTQPSPYDASSGSLGHSRQQSYSGQPVDGAPLSNIPEQAVNAQPFQPNAAPPHTFFQPQPFPMFHYPNTDGQPDMNNNDAVSQPQFYLYSQQPQQGGFMAPMMLQPPAAQSAEDQAGSSGMFAHESNGMVYYYPQMMPPVEGISDPSHFPGVPGPELYYYNPVPQGMMYYHPQ